MKLLICFLFNAALLAVLLPWLRQQWLWAATRVWHSVFVLGLGLRVVVGVARNWHPQADAEFMSGVSHLVTAEIRLHPLGTWRILTQAITIFPKGKAPYDFVFQNTSNTWILTKILAVLNLGSLDIDWINALYLSLFAFTGCWALVRQLADVFPKTPAGAGAVAFLLWPSVWFWATGISKEAVLLASGAWLTAKAIEYFYGHVQSGYVWLRGGISSVALALLHFGMRYFFAIPLLGVLSAISLGQVLKHIGLFHRRWTQVLVILMVLFIGAWIMPQMSVAFSMNKFTNQVMTVYNFGVAHSAGRPHFEYPELRPTGESIAAHAPLATANALTRPWLGESWQPLYFAAGVENAVLIVLLIITVWALVRGRPGMLPFGLTLGLVIFCLILAFLIGITTPNLGTLNRYRSGLLPYLLLLLLQHDYAAAAFRRLGLGKWPWS